MNSNLIAWATKWKIPPEALQELRAQMGVFDYPIPGDDKIGTEAYATKMVRMAAAKHGVTLWRNNVGAGKDEHGNFFRFGLANDTPQMNKSIKSSDLIGIGPDGKFYAREVKKPGWRYMGTEREQAQLKFLELVTARGGDASFTTGEF